MRACERPHACRLPSPAPALTAVVGSSVAAWRATASTSTCRMLLRRRRALGVMRCDHPSLSCTTTAPFLRVACRESAAACVQARRVRGGVGGWVGGRAGRRGQQAVVGRAWTVRPRARTLGLGRQPAPPWAAAAEGVIPHLESLRLRLPLLLPLVGDEAVRVAADVAAEAALQEEAVHGALAAPLRGTCMVGTVGGRRGRRRRRRRRRRGRTRQARRGDWLAAQAGAPYSICCCAHRAGQQAAHLQAQGKRPTCKRKPTAMGAFLPRSQRAQ